MSCKSLAKSQLTESSTLRAKLQIIQNEAKILLKRYATEKPGRTSRNMIRKEKSSMYPSCLGKVYQKTGKEYEVLECCYTFTDMSSNTCKPMSQSHNKTSSRKSLYQKVLLDRLNNKYK